MPYTDKRYLLLEIDAAEDIASPAELSIKIREGRNNGFTVVYDMNKDGECTLADLYDYVSLSIYGDE